MPFLRKRLRILKARTARMPVEKVYGTKVVIQKERPGSRMADPVFLYFHQNFITV